MKYVVPFILGFCAIGCASPKGATALEQRDYVNKMHDQTLRELYQQNPEAQEKVTSAAGHAVFSYFGTNLILLSTEGGYGVVVDHRNDNKTYMRLNGGGLGIGLGVKDARVIFVFNDTTSLDAFLSDTGKFTVGANADAIAKSDDQGGGNSGIARSGDVQIYTVNRNGFALAAAVMGTRYYRDDFLNAPDTAAPNPSTETVAEIDHEFLDPADDYENAPATQGGSADTQPGNDYDD
jgi:lipid-binding SYLF domain-containing protein